jgi:PAS domain S-box-containing protein
MPAGHAASFPADKSDEALSRHGARRAGAEQELVQSALGSKIYRYALAPIFIGLALLVSELLHPAAAWCVDCVFLAAIVAAAWLGGRIPGLAAALLALFTLDYFFLPPLHTLAIGRQARPELLSFVIWALLTAWLSSAQSGASEARALLEQSQEKFRRILTNQPDIAWTADEKGRVAYISPKILDWTGYSSQEVCSGGLTFLLGRVHADDRSGVQLAVDNLFSGRGPFDVEFRFQSKDGAWLWLHNRAMGTYRQKGVTLADGVLSDVSRRKWWESELQSKTAFLEAQINSTIDGILVVDTDDRRILHNRRVVELFGIPPALLLRPEQLPVRQHMLSRVRDERKSLDKLGRFAANPDETSRDEIELIDGTALDVYSSPVKGPAGEHYGRIWAFRDITERRRREDTLRQLSAAVEQSPVSVVITDPDGLITYVNRKFTECTGYTLEEVRGRSTSIQKSGYSSPELYSSLWTTIRGGREWRGELCNKKKNGELYWEAAVISPIMGPDGVITNFVAVKEDITERRALESELRQAQKLEAIGQLAAGIAHEINTPTQFVTDNLTFLEESWNEVSRLLESYRKAVRDHSGEFPEEVTAALEQAERHSDLEFIRAEAPRAIAQSLEGARRVAKIVRAMKEFSHPDLADRTDADLNRGILSTITIASSEWKHVAEVITELDEALPPVHCYPGDVNQVILNLIVNAAHAIANKTRGEGKGRIVVRTESRGAFAQIAVSDTGTGITEEIRTRVFEPFFTTREVGSGTGQGLSLAHSIVVKKHGGKIWFESEVGCGTTFYVRLPFHPLPLEGENQC